MTRTPARWVRLSADPSDPTQPHPTDRVLHEDGPMLWIGPEGDGHAWHTDLSRPLVGESPLRGELWISELGEQRLAPDGLSRWWPPAGLWLLALEEWALTSGYAYPPPPMIDSDGDGVPDDQDADPYDLLVQ
jgi:hypothetical protein